MRLRIVRCRFNSYRQYSGTSRTDKERWLVKVSPPVGDQYCVDTTARQGSKSPVKGTGLKATYLLQVLPTLRARLVLTLFGVGKGAVPGW